jgi:NADPH-dependent 2,4-dienoyl-CoA reductase/sulfur reductase-like enzyme/nitrite reductase/ring-hydroxylating ferredoxin subunit
MTLYATTRLDQLSEQRGTRVKAGDQDVLLVRMGDQVRAYQADCPHAGAPLEDGAICEQRLVCPWHKGAFAIADGEVTEPPALLRLERYPAHVEEGTVWVDDQPEPAPTPAPQAQDRCFAVVGAGAAGSAAIAHLKAQGYSGMLVWIDPQLDPSYDRTALSKFVIAGQMPPEATPALLDQATLHSPGLTLLQDAVTHVDSEAKTLTLATGRQLQYDAALLATGGLAQRPDLPGAALAGSFLLRSREDAAQLLDAARGRERAVIIGDSFIGLEAASALRQLGLQVHVISRHAVPMAYVLGEPIGRALRDLHEQQGVVFHSPAELKALEGETHVQTVLLGNGERIATDIVLFGTGVHPATAYAQGLPAADDHSLRVDAGLRVVDGLWAAGDIVTFPLAGAPARIEHWRLAQQHAVVAAANMLGEHREYADVPFFWTYHYGKNIEMLGHAREWDRLQVIGDLAAFKFIALQCQDDRVRAVVACGYQRVMAALSQRMKRAVSVEEVMEVIETFSD